MALSDEAQIVEIWEGFAAEDFRYASHDGEVRDFGDANDQRRERLPIRQTLLEQFLDGEIDVESFKSEMASEAGSNKLWGYSGPSGGMFFNMLVSAAGSEEGVSELTRLLREVLVEPGDRETAAQNIQRLEEHVEQLRSEADNIQSAPQMGYIPYFISYFWQLQAPDTYPIYYRSMRDALSELGIWETSGNLSEDYLNFWALNEEIRDVLEEHAGRDIHLWTIERMFLYWLKRDQIESRETSLTDEQEAILELWRDAASRHARAKHFNFGGKYTPDDAQDLANEFIEYPSERAFTSLWDPMHSAQRAGSAEVIYEKWTDEKGKSDEELADLIAEIQSATEYDPSWEAELGAKRTVWELFGLLHIEQYPIINGSTEQGLEFFGYETPEDYGGAVEEFKAFKRDYQQTVGHATADTDHAVPQNLEIDQLLNVIDKVTEEAPDQATHDEVAQLYRAVLDVKDEKAQDETADDRGAGVLEPLTPIPGPPDNAATIERQFLRAGQLVFHGPPGTGKTYTAQRFARWWLDQQSSQPTEDQLEVVTFHPSFTYEDFIEGLTAKEADGAVEYRVEDGVFKRLSQRARAEYESADEPKSYVLIIDEINRGNLAQIFGETITLLEADKRLDGDSATTVTLPHSGDKFAVPPNLYVIGTMNTADRSIALVDAALRRRFRFIAFPPDLKVLHREHGFSGAKDVSATAESAADPVRQLIALSILGLDDLNESILEAPDLGKGKQIGHSYLLDIEEGATREERLRSIVDAWHYEILPLLEEYYFGQFDRIQRDLFDGGGGRLFDWGTEQIRNFEAPDLAQTLIELSPLETTWAGEQADEPESIFTLQYLLDTDLLNAGDELVFDSQKVPEKATRTFDDAEAFWRCEVTGNEGQQDNVRWQDNGELYSLTGLARTILEEISGTDKKLNGATYWRHPDHGDQLLRDLRNAHEAGDTEGTQTPRIGEGGE